MVYSSSMLVLPPAVWIFSLFAISLQLDPKFLNAHSLLIIYFQYTIFGTLYFLKLYFEWNFILFLSWCQPIYFVYLNTSVLIFKCAQLKTWKNNAEVLYLQWSRGDQCLPWSLVFLEVLWVPEVLACLVVLASLSPPSLPSAVGMSLSWPDPEGLSPQARPSVPVVPEAQSCPLDPFLLSLLLDPKNLKNRLVFS